MGWLHAARARLHLLQRGDAEARMDEEIRFHLDMEAERLAREEGLPPGEARRRAVLAFGGVQAQREAIREGRTLAWIGGLSLDLKLGVRMLRKYPGLTVVSGLAIAFAIWVGAGTFELLTQIVHPSLPLPQGERVVGIRLWDPVTRQPVQPALRDFVRWRNHSQTVEALGAYRVSEHNLIAPGVPVLPIQAAELTASGFRVAGVKPLLGRTLVAEDESTTAPLVVVLGYEVWQGRFGADSGIVGREVRLGRTPHTVVGVMPEGFAFPVAHELWTPLRPEAIRSAAAVEGPVVRVFGRLSPGETVGSAEAELATIGRVAAEGAVTREHLRPQVQSYPRSVMQLSAAEAAGVLSLNLFMVALLLLVCGNVALLMFARAISRRNDIVVRSALGASRGRIILQLFVEALVVAALAAAVGLAATHLGLRWVLGALESEITGEFLGLPFWISARLSPATILYAGLLTLLGAAIAGVLPALTLTRGLGAQLRQASVGSGYRFGGVWSAVIVAQIAVAVSFPAFAWFLHREAARSQARDIGFASQEYLAARVETETDSGGPAASGGTAYPEAKHAQATVARLERAVESHPAVRGASFAGHLPRMNHRDRRVELAASAGASGSNERIAQTFVALDYFEVLGVPILQGRGFHPSDLESGAPVAIVNEAFVQRVLGGRDPLGLRLRYRHSARQALANRQEEEPWHQVIGVVQNLGMSVEEQGIYHPATPGTAFPLHMVVHVGGEPEAFATQLRQLAATVDPTLRLHQVVPLNKVKEESLLTFSAWLVVLVSAIALLLSLAAIYAVMAFTVSQRTREMAIRVALGADAKHIVLEILRRPLAQVAAGTMVGGALTAAIPLVIEMETLSARGLLLVAAYAAVMMGLCLLACVVPARRALKVEPMVALRAE